MRQMTDEQAQVAREFVQRHIDELNANYRARAVEGMQRDNDQFKTYSKRSTYLVWAMLWASGFLARGVFNDDPVQWNLASFFLGFAAGACLYCAVHAFMLGKSK